MSTSSYQLLSETKKQIQLAAITNPGQRPLPMLPNTFSEDNNHQLNNQVENRGLNINFFVDNWT